MTSENTRFTGRVKWFNNQAGYGFITSRLGGEEDRDVFVHHTSVTTQQDQFRYLVQGEYVSFTLAESQDENAEHRTTAQDVKGADGGMLMCETRLERRNSQQQRLSRDERPQRRPMRGRPMRGGPRGGQRQQDGVEWVLVRRRNDVGDSRRGRGGGMRGGGMRGSGRPRTHQPRIQSDE